MNILEELWYGNIDPMEAVGSGGPQYKELMALMAKNREKIAATLTNEMQEVLETYDDNIREMDSIAEKEAFIYGFRLGMQLAAESLTDRRQEK